ncbi:MAG: ERF family protein [Candidatus Obscuribacterales bacterium]|nr:ERF family protein [Candidatus Obscuribacterales bacterium]
MTTETLTPPEEIVQRPLNKSIHKKLADIQGKLGRIDKSGTNDYAKYEYATEADFLAAVGPLCAEANVSTVASCIQHEVNAWESGNKRKTSASVVIELTLTCAETGESVVTTMPGYAEDTGDKSLYKAITGATKYAYWKAFRLATGDDPEKDTPAKSGDRNLTEAERDKLAGLMKTNGWSGADAVQFAKQFPGEQITLASYQRALAYFGTKKQPKE